MDSASQRGKTLRGELYSAMDPELVAARVRARWLFACYNASDPADIIGRDASMRELLGRVGPGAAIEPPFYCDYGTQITLGAGVFVNSPRCSSIRRRSRSARRLSSGLTRSF